LAATCTTRLSRAILAKFAPPSALSGWSNPVPLAAAVAGLDAATLALGRAAVVALRSTGEAAYVILPQKPGGAQAHGGLLAVDIAQAGTYQVSLSSGDGSMFWRMARSWRPRRMRRVRPAPASARWCSLP
jgi:hypothetical protein